MDNNENKKIQEEITRKTIKLFIKRGRRSLQFIGINSNDLKMDIKYFSEHPNDSEVKKDLLSFAEENLKQVKNFSELIENLEKEIL